MCRVIVENKFQPPTNEKTINSYGIDHLDMHKIILKLTF